MIINGNSIHSESELYDALSSGLGFPAHFGRNADALYDCLCEPGEKKLIITNEAGLQKALGSKEWPAIKRAMADAASENGDAFIAFGVTVLCYPGCSTCKKALSWLKSNGIDCICRNIAEENPTASELLGWQAKSGLPMKRFFNTSGVKYRSMGLSSKLQSMDGRRQAEILSSDGMLVKRPILLAGEKVLVGFSEDEWSDVLIGK